MKSIRQLLGPDGFLADAHDNYEHRPQQIEMAEAVGRSLEKRRPLVVEAATGTGKTLAYLVPALRSGKRVVISTGTKALQEQLFYKDLPFLERHWPQPFDAVLLKGRKNYLCKMRFQEIVDGPRSVPHEHRSLWRDIRKWARKTETGDRAEIDNLPDNSPFWNDLSVGAESCLRSQCPFYEECHVTQAREEAQEADIIVVNHHLFFADLSLRDQGFGEILPEYDAVIFDEAHHLEGVATSYFGMKFSNYRVKDYISDVRRAFDNDDIDDPETDEALRELSDAQKDFFSLVSFGLYDGRYPIEKALKGSQEEKIKKTREELLDALGEVDHAIAQVQGLGEVSNQLRERCREMSQDLRHVTNHDDERYAYFVEKHKRGVFLQAAPIDLAKLFRSKLLDTHDSLVFTSATLATGGNLSFFKNRLGMHLTEGEDEIEELILESDFDYDEQAILYVPHKLPEPSADNFTDLAARVVEYLLDITDGRAFILFTSYKNLNAVHDALVDELDYTVFKQGDLPKREILEKFQADTHSVLFATSSFWEGVDIEGEALSMVVIDKLPFANPSDPLVKARMDLLESRGLNSFAAYSLPTAALSLKQGFGRLIRSKSDQGVVAILDSRIANKRYGNYFLDSLPSAPVAWTAPEVKGWWENNSL